MNLNKAEAAILKLFCSQEGLVFNQEQLISFLADPDFSPEEIVSAIKNLLAEGELSSLPEDDEAYILTTDLTRQEEELAKYVSHHVVCLP